MLPFGVAALWSLPGFRKILQQKVFFWQSKSYELMNIDRNTIVPPKMATETTLQNVNVTADQKSHSQVKIQLTTRHPDISLPETPGPILVSTSKSCPRPRINSNSRR